MRKFILKLALFVSIFLVAILVLNGTQEQLVTNEGYMEGMVIKHERVKSIPGPKLLLVGGSNLAFGVDSEVLEDRLKVPVVNMGLHAGLGASFILNELEDVVESGDVVVLSFEYFLPLKGKYSLLDQARTCYPPADAYFRKNAFRELSIYFEQTEQNWKGLFSNADEELERTEAEQVRNVYSSSAFNAYGDVVSHIGLPSKEELKGKAVFKLKYWKVIDAINQMAERLRARGAEVFYMFPAFPKEQYELNREGLELLEKDVKRGLSIPVLNTVGDVLYPVNEFYDTVYHLNSKGRVKRTNEILQMLEANERASAAIASLKVLDRSRQ